jgi:GntR family transcriptional regulator / MocR family aminotransferase
VSIYNADAGLHLSTFLADSLDDHTVTKRMAERGLVATTLSSCYVGPVRRSGFFLGFGGTDEAGLLTATQGLGAVLHGMNTPHSCDL